MYLAVHLGVAELFFVGWDIGNTKGNNVHFYDRPTTEAFYDRVGPGAHRLKSIRSRQPAGVQHIARRARAMCSYSRGAVYNRTTMLPGEAELVAGSTADLARWLRARGIGPLSSPIGPCPRPRT